MSIHSSDDSTYTMHVYLTYVYIMDTYIYIYLYPTLLSLYIHGGICE